MQSSWRRYWPEVTGAAALAIASIYPVQNADTYGHLAVGRWIVEHGYVPVVDSFSYSPDKPTYWTNYEWGSEVVLYLSYLVGRETGVLCLLALVMAAAGAVVVATARKLGANPVWTSALLIASIPMIRGRLTPRPHNFGVLLTAGYLYFAPRLFEDTPTRTFLRRLALLAVVHTTWVNLHGSHLLGALYIGVLCGFQLIDAKLARDSVLRSALVLGTVGASSMISPFGPRIVRDSVVHLADPAYRALVSEWAPWSPTQPPSMLIAMLFALALIAAAFRTAKHQRAPMRAHWVLSVVLAVLALRSLRFIEEYLVLAAPVAAIGAALLAARAVPARIVTSPLASPSAFVLVVAASLYGTAHARGAFALGVGASEHELPAASGRALAKLGEGVRVYASLPDSWYLQFAAPNIQTLVDGRVPYFGAETLTRYAKARQELTTLQDLLDRTDTNVVVVPAQLPGWEALSFELAGTEEWEPILFEDEHVMLAREGSFPNVRRVSLPIGVSPYVWLDAMKTDPAMSRNLATLVDPKARRLGAFGEAISKLSAHLPRGTYGGIEPPRTAIGRKELAQIGASFRELSLAIGDIPSLLLWESLIASALCDPPTAEQHLERARRAQGNQTRDMILARLEILLRQKRDPTLERTLNSLEQARNAPDLAWVKHLRTLSPQVCK